MTVFEHIFLAGFIFRCKHVSGICRVKHVPNKTTQYSRVVCLTKD